MRSFIRVLLLLPVLCFFGCPPHDDTPSTNPSATDATAHTATPVPESILPRITTALQNVESRDVASTHGFWTVFHAILGLGPDVTLVDPQTGARIKATRSHLYRHRHPRPGVRANERRHRCRHDGRHRRRPGPSGPVRRRDGRVGRPRGPAGHGQRQGVHLRRLLPLRQDARQRHQEPGAELGDRDHWLALRHGPRVDQYVRREGPLRGHRPLRAEPADRHRGVRRHASAVGPDVGLSAPPRPRRPGHRRVEGPAREDGTLPGQRPQIPAPGRFVLDRVRQQGGGQQGAAGPHRQHRPRAGVARIGAERRGAAAAVDAAGRERAGGDDPGQPEQPNRRRGAVSRGARVVYLPSSRVRRGRTTRAARGGAFAARGRRSLRRQAKRRRKLRRPRCR